MRRTEYLVSGGSGLLGKKVMENLVRSGDEVTSIGRTHPYLTNDFHTLNMDFSKPATMNNLKNLSKTIIHLAQSRNYQDFPTNALEIFNVNVSSTVQILSKAHISGSEVFLYASTGGIYRPSLESLTENSLLNSRDTLNFYLATKFAGESFVNSYQQIMKTKILRYFFIYGSGQAETMLIPRLVNKVLSGESINVDGDKGISLTPIFVDDAAEATIKAAKNEFVGTINIAGDEVLSIADIAYTIGDILGEKVNLVRSGKPVEHNLIADNTQMKYLLCKPKVSFFNGLKILIDSILEKI